MGDLDFNLLPCVTRLELFDRRLGYHATAAKNRHRVADTLDVGKDVRGEEDGGAPTQRYEHVQNFLASHWVERARWFVEQQQPRCVDQGLGYTETLFHAAGVAT